MKEKRYFLTTIAVFAIIILAIFIRNYTYDPFGVYGYSDNQEYLTLEYEQYYNYGYAKHLKYDTVLTGSCMSVDFYEKDFSTKDGIVKLSMVANPLDQVKMINLALESDNNVRRVIMSEDMWVLGTDGCALEYPEYIYNGPGADDINYLLNKDTLTFDIVSANLERSGIADLMENKNWHRECSEAIMLQTEDIQGMLDIYEECLRTNDFPNDETYMDEINASTTRKVVGYIEEVVKANPDIRFDIFFPPYSIMALEWAKYSAGGLNYILDQEKLWVDVLVDYPNVNIYEFQTAEDIIYNLDNYCDKVHFSENVYAWEAEQINKGNYRLTRENYIEEIDKIKKITDEFDLSPYVK